MNELTKFDSWIKDGGPAALILRELLEPVEGPEGVFFPATYAAAEDKTKFSGGYNIDVFPTDERAIGEAAMGARDGRFRLTIDLFPNSPNICLIDSVGAQANRIEPMFSQPRYRNLVPQIVIKAGEKPVNLLQVGHRAADALVRFSKAGETVWTAFQALLRDRNAEPMAKIAPTSLVFGVWDSRGTQVKVARIFRSVIRAYNVRKLSRSAQFNRATKYVEEGVIAEALDTGDGDKNPLSREGFKDSPATASHGGVIAKGDICREITINLVAIRRLFAGVIDDLDAEDNVKLRRYILGLALVAGTAVTDDLFDLREGCQLRQKPKTQSVWQAVPHRGENVIVQDLTDAVAINYAHAAAMDFGVGPSGEFTFDKATTEKWLALKKEDQEKRRRNGPMSRQFDGGTDESIVEVSSPTPRKGAKKRGGSE
jgi:CRISPR-associated protein Csb1